jgi:transposase-like protein
LAFIDWGSWWLGPEWVYVDETKIKARDGTYYLWLAVDDESSLQWNGYMSISGMFKKLTSWTAKLVLEKLKASKGCTTDKGALVCPVHVNGLCQWNGLLLRLLGTRNVVERTCTFLTKKNRIKRWNHFLIVSMLTS